MCASPHILFRLSNQEEEEEEECGACVIYGGEKCIQGFCEET